MYRIFDLFRFLVVPTNDGVFHVGVRTIFQNDDGTTDHCDNYHVEFGFPTLVNADQIAIFNHRGNILITKTGSGEFEIEFAGLYSVIERCYACGWLYPESREYQSSRIGGTRYYDPTDFECGCTARALEAKAADPTLIYADGLIWANPPYDEIPAKPDANNFWLEFARKFAQEFAK